jgi:hypothetical protein
MTTVVVLRLARAYGLVPAVAGSAALVVVGLVLQSRTIGVTRQPLPLVWPLAVLHVVVAQLLLPDILGAVEQVARRRASVRSARALGALALLLAAPLTYAAGNRALIVFLLAVAAAGFATAAIGRVEPWVTTLGLGLAGVGLLFITPLGGPISRFLTGVPLGVGAVLVAATAAGYALLQRTRSTRVSSQTG